MLVQFFTVNENDVKIKLSDLLVEIVQNIYDKMLLAR